MARVLPAIALLLLLLAAPHPAAADNAYAEAPGAIPALFNTTEIRSPNLTSFTNWTSVLARFNKNKDLGAGMCATAAGRAGSPSLCEWDAWQKIVRELKDLPPQQQLVRVNDEMNKRPYILDNVNWGMNDYWATVFEFLRKNGDCEDYAIAKYVTLRALGWNADRLRIVVLRDTKLNLNHAILAAYTDDGIFIGDNQITGLARASNIRHYKAIYSINENSWWLHRAASR